MTEEIKGEGDGQTLSVRVEEARLKRDEDSRQPALLWQLRRGDGKFIRFEQVFAAEAMDEIKRNLALCGIVCSNDELPSQLVRAKGCELEVKLEGAHVAFLRRLDGNVFAGVIDPQNVAEEIPL